MEVDPQDFPRFDDGEYYDDTGDEFEAGTRRPAHLQHYVEVKGVVVATSSAVPEVYTFPNGPAPSCIGFRATPDGPSLQTTKAILDTGANIVLGSLAWAERNGLQWQPCSTLKMRTSSGDSFETCGRLSQPLIIVLCAGTPHQMKVAVDCYVMQQQADLYDLLVGTPLVNAVGGEISAFSSTFTYHPELHREGGDVSVTKSIGICTYACTASDTYRDSTRFLLGAVSAWVHPRAG
jgi:hypothetical protein